MTSAIYTNLWAFFIYSVVGWAVEVAFAAISTKKFVNRGYLNGPFCPIYGCGIVLISNLLIPFADNLFLLFAGVFVLTTLLEFLTGFMMDKLFGRKWWDYSDERFNIMGYVSLRYSVAWAVGGVFVLKVVHPVIIELIRLIPEALGGPVLALMLLALAADMAVTTVGTMNLKKRIDDIEEVVARIASLSDRLGEKVYESAIEVMGRVETRKNELQELLARHSALIKPNGFVQSRLIGAFPNLKKAFDRFEREHRGNTDGSKDNQ